MGATKSRRNPGPIVQEPQSRVPQARGEAVIALVAPMGVDVRPVENTIDTFLGQCGFTVERYRLSDYIAYYAKVFQKKKLPTSPEYNRIDGLIKAGNELRETLGVSAIADFAVTAISAKRPDGGQNRDGCIYVLSTIKNPDELAALRDIYGQSLYVIGVTASEDKRRDHLRQFGRMTKAQAMSLIGRDEADQVRHGQQTRETFHRADVYVDVGALKLARQQLRRFLRLLCGDCSITPTRDEHGMFMAYCASLRSGSLARQVGAAIVDDKGQVLATGCNDLPRVGGGVTWHSDDPHTSSRPRTDPNDTEKYRLLVRVVLALKGSPRMESELSDSERRVHVEEGKHRLRDSGLLDLTEFSTDVHAEMDALLCAASRGTRIHGATLYTTTFPCHNCAKHIVAAGIQRVVYVEPYPKSRAADLLADYVSINQRSTAQRVVFRPLVGVGSRRFVELFSLSTGRGDVLRRKDGEGTELAWSPERAALRACAQPSSYMVREQLAVDRLRRVAQSRLAGGTRT